MNTKSLNLYNGTESCNDPPDISISSGTTLNWNKHKPLKSKDVSLPFMDLTKSSVSSSNSDDFDTSSTSTSMPHINDIHDRVTTVEQNHHRILTDRSPDGETFDETLNTSNRVKKLTPWWSHGGNASNNLRGFQQYCSSTYPTSFTSSRHLSSSQMLSDDEILVVEQKVTPSNSADTRGRNAENLLSLKRVPGNAALKQQETKDYTSDSLDSQPSTPTFYFQPVIPQEYRTVFNVAGRIFDVDIRKLDQFPETLLGTSESRAQFFDQSYNEYFLDRHRNIFEVVLDFYENGGILRRPDEIPIDIFINEIKFYRFGLETLKHYLKEEGILVERKSKPLPKGKVKQFIWNLFEDHTDSCLAKVVTLISAIVIAISVTVFCLETIPNFETLGNDLHGKFEPAFNRCRSYIDNLYDANQSNRFEIPRIDKNNSIFEQLELTSMFCSRNTNASLADIYIYERCLIEISSEKQNLDSLLNETNFEKNEEVVENDSQHLKTKRKLRHQQEIVFTNPIQENGEIETRFDTLKRVSGNQTELKDDKLQNSSTKNHTDLLKLKFLAKNLEIVRKICPLVDLTSRVSPVYWLVLEAELGSLAGILFLTESACIIWFLAELGLRFFACPDKIKFCKDFLNIVDTLAILPYFITLIVMSFQTKVHMRPQTATILRTIRLVRMLRVLKLSRYSRGFRILGLTLIRSTRVLCLLVGFEVVLAVTFSSIAYFVEYGAPGTQFLSIPDAFWWALITMTTVGYGDVAPITLMGKLAGAGCAIMGILCISFPVPVIVSNFNYLYNLDKDDCKLVPEDLMTDSWDGKDKQNNVEKFQENLFNAVRKTAGSEESSPSHSASIMWNNVRRQTRKMSAGSVDVRSDKCKISKSNSGTNVLESSNLLTPI